MFSFCVLPISRIGLKQRFTACSWCIDSWYARTAECWWWRWTLIHFHIKPFMNWPCGSSVGQLFNCAPYSVDCLQYCRSPRHLNKLMPRCLCTSQRCHNTHSKEEEKKPVSCRSQDIQWTVILDDIRCSCDRSAVAFFLLSQMLRCRAAVTCFFSLLHALLSVHGKTVKCFFSSCCSCGSDAQAAVKCLCWRFFLNRFRLEMFFCNKKWSQCSMAFSFH